MIELETIKSSVAVTVDRPDIVKRESKKNLTFKEVKEAFFKFLFQVGIPFSVGEKLNIFVEVEDKNFGEVYSHNAAYYNSTCKLEGITVNKKPIYIIVLNSNYDSIEKRQKNKLITLKRDHNIIIFDKQDWGSFSLDIVDRQWLSALNKKVLRRWSKSLFDKIGKLQGDVKSKYTLNDVYERIDSLGYKEDSNYLQKLMDENKELKYQLRLQLISDSFALKPPHNFIVKKLSELNEASTAWCETILTNIISIFNHKKVNFKDFNYISETIYKKIKDIEITNLVSNLQTENLLIRIKNVKTFQEMYINLTSNPTIKLPKASIETLGNFLIYNFVLTSDSKNEKIENINGTISFSNYFTSTSSTFVTFNSTRQLPIYESKIDKEYSLCLPKLDNQ